MKLPNLSVRKRNISERYETGKTILNPVNRYGIFGASLCYCSLLLLQI